MAELISYEIPSSIASSFSAKEITDIKIFFRDIDSDHDGILDMNEMIKVLKKIGDIVTETDIKKYTSKSEGFTFNDFVMTAHTKRQSGATEVLSSVMKQKTANYTTTETSGGILHSFSDEEKVY